VGDGEEASKTIAEIIQAGKAIIVILIIILILYGAVVGSKEFREEDMVRQTERIWDLEQRIREEHEADEYYEVNDDVDEEEWWLVKRRRRR